MKSIPLIERKTYYNELLKEETRKRLDRSYDTVNRSLFFKEAFDILADYDLDHIFMNFFLDEEVDDIMLDLGLSYFEKYRDMSENILFKRFNVYLHSINDITDFRIDNFLKKEFKEFICDDDVVWNTKSNWPRPKKDFLWIYANWIVTELGEGHFDEALYLSIIFHKIWIEDADLTKNHRYTKAMLFLQTIIRRFDFLIARDVYPNIDSLCRKLTALLNKSFITNFYTSPLTEVIDKHQNASYLEMLKQFKETCELSHILNRSYEGQSYYELLLMLKDDTLTAPQMQSISNAIAKKVNQGIKCDQEELIMISTVVLDTSADRIRIDFYRSLYLFEFI